MYYVIIWKLTLQRGFKQPNFIFSMQKSEFRFIETKIKFYKCKIQLLKRKKAELEKPSSTLDEFLEQS